MTLGFSPQPLVAALAARLSRGLEPRVTVVTSPEVAESRVPAARLSGRVLSAFREAGLVAEVRVAPMAPGPGTPPRAVMESLVEAFRALGGRGVVDISGGTQLAAIAAVKSGLRRLSYTYPVGDHVEIHVFEVE